MSDMKCPICGQELKHEKTTGIYCCPTTFIDCPLGLGTGAFGTKELWQELIRTRKALDVAVDALTTIGGYLDYNDCVGIALDAKDEIYETLEQKDVK